MSFHFDIGQVIDEIDKFDLIVGKNGLDGISRQQLFKHIYNEAQSFVSEKSNLEKLVSYMDLTTLSGDDTPKRVEKLVDRALNPVSNSKVRCASVCIYPARVRDAVQRVKQFDAELPIASVAAGFPSGQYLLDTRLAEIRLAVADGATEIDAVIERSHVLREKGADWARLYVELKRMREACGGADVRLKVILSTGDLGSERNIYGASIAAMMAGADFIKTSTGKEQVNATLDAAFVMCTAIRRFEELLIMRNSNNKCIDAVTTTRRVGFKPAGGIRNAEQAAHYALLTRQLLGAAWTEPTLFRIGASVPLLDDICNRLRSAK